MSAPAGSGDATVNIPLGEVSGYGRADSITPLHQKEMSDSPPSSAPHMHGPIRRVKFDARARTTDMNNEEATLNRMGRFYRRVLEFSIVTRYFIYVSPVALCIAVPIIVGATAAPDARLGEVSITWFFTWIEIVWLSLWVSKIVSHFMPYLFQIITGVVSSGTRKYAMVIRALEIPLSLVGWAVTSIATFVPLMLRNPDSRKRNLAKQDWMTIVQEILGAAVVSTLVLLGERLIIQLLSIGYHRKQFNSRIMDSKRQVFILTLLYEGSRKMFPMYCDEFAEEDFAIADQLGLGAIVGGKKNSKTHKRSGSATPMRLIREAGRFGDKVTSAFGNMAQEITGKQVFNPNSAHSVVVSALEKKRTSEALARRIWLSYVMEGNDALSEEDILDVLGKEHAAEAEEAFANLDRDGNGDISLEEMILTVADISRERKSINTSMHDVDQAINVLDRLLLTVVLIAVVFIFVAFLNSSFTTTLATTGTALLSLSFVFSVTCQEILGSCIFVFVKHPFDVGDRVDINTDELIVEHISLLFTVFRRTTGANVGRTVQIPNIVLNTLWIENVSRSKAMKEQLSLMISFDTSFEDIQLLKQEMLNFVREKENSRDYQPDLDVQVLGTSDLSKLELRVEIQHKSNWANEAIRAQRRSKFMCALVAALRRIPINAPGGGGDAAGTAMNANYSVTIDEATAKANAAAAEKAKNDARLVPIKKAEVETELRHRSSTLLTKKESGAINELTSRDPQMDFLRDEILEEEEPASGVGELPTMKPSDEADIKGIIGGKSLRGRRKADGSDLNRAASNATATTLTVPQPYISVGDYAQPQPASDVYGYHPAHRPSQGEQLRSMPSRSSADARRRASNPYRTVSRDDDGYGEV